MMLGELETARRMGLTFTVVVVNNAASGYVKALQHLMYGPGAYHASDLAETNYARVAEALGCRGIRVERPDDLAAALREGLGSQGPTIVGSLAYLEALGIAAAAVSHLSCRIGDTADMLERWTISRANGPASLVGVRQGCTCREAAGLLKTAPHLLVAAPPIGEARREFTVTGSRRRIWLLDSASLVRAPKMPARSW